MPKPPRYHLGGVRREQWIANRIALLRKRAGADLNELLTLLELPPQALNDLLNDQHDSLSSDLEMFRETKDQPNTDATIQDLKVIELLREVTR